MFSQKLKEGKILVVDDQEANVSLLENLLEREGYTRILGITDSRQARKLFTEFEPDLVILDLLMPHLDGFAVMEQLNQLIPADTYLPILILTADITPEVRLHALSSGAKDFITKPINVIEVGLRIRNLLETRFLHLQIQNRSQILNELVLERTAELTHTNEELAHANTQLWSEINERKAAEARSQHEAARAEALLRIASRLNTQLNLDTVLKTICEAAANALNTPAATVYLYEARQDELVYTAGFGMPRNYHLQAQPVPRELYQRLISNPNHPFVTDIQLIPELFDLIPSATLDMRSVAGANLIRENQLIGNLNVYTFGQERVFTADDLALLQGLADQTAQAITNARLYEDAQRRLLNIQAMHRIDITISGSLDLHLSLKIILEELTRHIQVDAAAILIANPIMNNLEYAAGHGFKTDNIRQTNMLIGRGLPGQVALERQPIFIPEGVEQQFEARRFDLLAPEKFQAYYGIPLIAKGQLQGVLEIFNRSPLDIEGEWEDFVSTLAGQAALAIENTVLFNNLQRSNTELALAYDITLEGWSRAMDLRDRETEGHTQRVAELTVRMAQALGIGEVETINARRGALLHDMGKLGIPDEILHKPGKLNEEEWEIMKKHPTYAYDMLSPIAYLRPALDIPYCHHEKWDGTGYPRGLKGEAIPIAARIFSVADVWDALRSDRPYRKAWSDDKVRDYIREHSGDYFDPKVVEVFLRIVEPHPAVNPKTDVRKMLIEE